MSASPKELQELARAKWKSSGLTDKHAQRLRFEVLPAAKVVALDGAFKEAGAMRLPYFDASGRPTKFYRIRYLEALPGFAGAATKPQRYAQPAGTLNEVYAPPLLDRPWTEVLADPETALYITEGELKAAAGCVAGLATLGLGGVDVWRSSTRGIEMLPLLRGVEWSERRVVIVYDSDAAHNENVVRAQRVLASALADRGALAYIASLPPTADGRKQGLDDFLVAEGADALRAMLDDPTLPPWSEAEALWGLNEEVVYVKDPGLVVVRGTGQKMSPEKFTAHHYSNRHYFEPTDRGLKARPLAKRWIEWDRRFELGRIAYVPGQQQIVSGTWNTWKGWGVEPKKGDIGPWKELLDYVFKMERPENRQWFERWCAYPLQHPGTKMFTSVVVWGINHGTGKTLMGYTVRDIYGPNGDEISDEDLRASFNEWAVDKQFIVGEEVTGEKPRSEADKFKRLITRQTVRINQKHIPTYVLTDCINYYFTSNHPDAFFIDDTDRRFFVHEVVGEPLSPEFYRRYDQWRKNGGPAALFYHLLHLPLGDFDPNGHAPQTSSKRAMIADNKSDLGMWCAALREDPKTTLKSAMVPDECDLLTPSQLLRAYDPTESTRVTANGLSRELKRAGFRQCNQGDTVRTAAGCKRLYIIRNPQAWVRAKATDCGAHWDSFFGPKGAKF